MTGRRLFFHSCVGVAALLSGAAAQVDNTDSTSTPDLIFKRNDLEWSKIELTPGTTGTCDDNYQYCIDIPQKDEGETVDSLEQKFRNDYRLFSQGWINLISADIEKRFDDYMSGTEVGIAAAANWAFSTVSSYALGVVVDNFYGVDLLNGKFKVDMKIFIREIERTTNKTLEEVKREAYAENSPDVVEIVGKDGRSYHELLTKPWAEVENTGRYKKKKAKALQKPMCSIAYQEKMKILTEADYKKLFGSEGLIIQHSTSKVDPVVDSNGNVVYLKAYGAQISFEAPNDRFFPFQSYILPIKLAFPRKREMDKTVICANSHFTGFQHPLESVSRTKTDVPYLSLVPTITDDHAPPYMGYGHIQMRNKYLKEDFSRNYDGSKMVESATFTVIYIPEYTDGLALTYPFLFIILSILLQWFTYTPNKFQHGQMVGAIMQLNSVVNAQKNYLQSNNLLTQVIYLTYGMVTANILTIALMSFINHSQESGERPTLVRLKGAIYRMLRVFVLLLALLLLPILIVKTDPYTGEQTDYDFIWYIVGFFALFCSAFSAFKEYKWYKEDNAASTNDEPPVANTDEEELVRMSSLSPGSEWTSEQVGKWIGNSDLVRDAAALTEGELLAIASKFIEANVNGTVFPLVAYDADALKRDVKLTVGEAVLFVHAMEKLSPSEGDQNGPRSQGGEIESGVHAL